MIDADAQYPKVEVDADAQYYPKVEKLWWLLLMDADARYPKVQVDADALIVAIVQVVVD